MKNGVQTEINEMANFLKEIISDLLRNSSDCLDVNSDFLELGINSVLAVELVEALNHKLGIDLGLEVVFDYPSIGGLAEYLASHYQKEQQHDPVQGSAVLGDFTTGQSQSDPDVGEGVSPRCNDDSLATQIEERASDIAIIGISGRFAGSETVEEFWEHLAAGDCCIGEINRHGWNESDYYDPDSAQKNKSVSKWGGMLKDIDKFDTQFFNISPLEANRMDPQQRLFMEEAFKAFEDAGYAPEQLSGNKAGVFVGVRTSDYKEITLTEKRSIRKHF